MKILLYVLLILGLFGLLTSFALFIIQQYADGFSYLFFSIAIITEFLVLRKRMKYLNR